MVLYNNDILHERVVEHLKKNGVEVPYVLARNILFMCDEALRNSPENTSSNKKLSEIKRSEQVLRFVRVKHEDERDDDMWFSFYCTVMDNFVWFNDNQIFRSKEHFIKSYVNKKEYEDSRDLNRFIKLIDDNLFTSPNKKLSEIKRS